MEQEERERAKERRMGLESKERDGKRRGGREKERRYSANTERERE